MYNFTLHYKPRIDAVLPIPPNIYLPSSFSEYYLCRLENDPNHNTLLLYEYTARKKDQLDPRQEYRIPESLFSTDGIRLRSSSNFKHFFWSHSTMLYCPLVFFLSIRKKRARRLKFLLLSPVNIKPAIDYLGETDHTIMGLYPVIYSDLSRYMTINTHYYIPNLLKNGELDYDFLFENLLRVSVSIRSAWEGSLFGSPTTPYSMHRYGKLLKHCRSDNLSPHVEVEEDLDFSEFNFKCNICFEDYFNPGLFPAYNKSFLKLGIHSLPGSYERFLKRLPQKMNDIFVEYSASNKEIFCSNTIVRSSKK